MVLNAHQEAAEALKPGVLYKDIHLLACKKLTEGLKPGGLMKGYPEEAVAVGAHTLLFNADQVT
jgi:Xaa-Pro aminopeptidase